MAISKRKGFILHCILLFSFNLAIAQQSEIITQEIKFKSGGTTLSGTILKPHNPVAAIVLVHGSGQEKRMLEVASLLAKKDIAVLTYDKRGVGQSAGTYAGPEVGTNNIDSANLTLLAQDASSAINELSDHLPGNKVPLGLLGFSQAGWIIPIAATQNMKIKFMVVFSGSLVTAREQLRFQFYTNGDAKFWDTHTEAEVKVHVMTDPDKYQFVDTYPLESLSRLKIAGLWIYGGKDIQVPVAMSIENLSGQIDKGKNFKFLVFPSLGHNTGVSASSEPMDQAVKWIKVIPKQDKW